MQDIYSKYADQGFIVVTLLTSGSATAWVQAASIEHPVLEIDANTAESIYPNVPGYPTGASFKPGIVVHQSPIVGGGAFTESMVGPLLP